MTTHKKSFYVLIFILLSFACVKKGNVEAINTFYFTDCGLAKVSGDYFKDSTLNATHEISLEAYAQKAGKWGIKTETVNGIYFSGSGEFSTTGLHVIKLKGTGKPVAPGLSQLRVEAGYDFCSVLVKVDTIAVAPCNPDNNSISGLATSSFYSISKREFGGTYRVQAFGNSCDLNFEFAGSTPPKSGAYRIKSLASDFYTGDVRVSLVTMSIYFQSSDGVVYVNNTNGIITLTFCNVRFTGSNGAVTISNTASARITK